MVKLRVTLTFEYEAVPEHYEGCGSPAEIAACDQGLFEEDPSMLVSMMDGQDFEIQVEPVQ